MVLCLYDAKALSELLMENVHDPLNCVKVTSAVRGGANRAHSSTWDELSVLSVSAAVKCSTYANRKPGSDVS